MKRQSIGATNIEKTLIKNRLPYIKEFTFDNCKDKYCLPFDFCIINTRRKPLYLIEFDGEHHYYPVTVFGGNKGHISTKKHDAIKNKYCLMNCIPLIRIPYWERETFLYEDLIPNTSRFLVSSVYHNDRYYITHPEKVKK